LTAYNAPPVTYPLGRSRFQAWFLVSLWLAGVLLAVSWFLMVPRLDWRLDVVCLSIAVTGVAALAAWKNSPSGQLVWDGQMWCWESPGYQAGVAEQQLSVIADFQGLMLLRIENQARASMWLLMEKAAMPERWLDLRRAVHSPRRTSNPTRISSPAVAALGDI
jgi:toxin CptA